MKIKILLILLIITLLNVGCINEKKRENDSMNYISKINVVINGNNYSADIENNKTAQSIINDLKEEFIMNDLNDNEKYVYMKNSYKVNLYNSNHIEKGDIMLYQDDCLVIFYKSFDTNYSYTKIGHINNLPDFDNKNITVKFEK